MSHLISPPSGAQTIGIPDTVGAPRRPVRLLFSVWWRAWRSIASDLGREGIR